MSADTAPAIALAERARVLLDLDRPREALPLLAQAAAADPGNARIFCLMALAHLNAGNFQDCVQAAEDAIRMAPDREWGHRLRACALLSLGRNEQALQSAQESVRLAPQEMRALHTLTRAQLQTGHVDEADATARALRALRPDATWAYEAMGLVALRQSRPQEAEEHFRAALRINALSYVAMNNLGVALQRRGCLREAIDCYHRAAVLKPAEQKAPYNLKKAVRLYLNSPLYLYLVAALGMTANYGLNHASRFGTAEWVTLGGIMLVIVPLPALRAWQRWRSLTPAMRSTAGPPILRRVIRFPFRRRH